MQILEVLFSLQKSFFLCGIYLFLEVRNLFLSSLTVCHATADFFFYLALNLSELYILESVSFQFKFQWNGICYISFNEGICFLCYLVFAKQLTQLELIHLYRWWQSFHTRLPECVFQMSSEEYQSCFLKLLCTDYLLLPRLECIIS